MIDTLALIYTPSIVDGYINLMSEIGAKINIDLKKSNEFRVVGKYKSLCLYRTNLCPY